MMNNKKELDRAERIIFTVDECHLLLDSIYEGLVDREFASAKSDAIKLIGELKIIIRSTENDDY